MADPSTIAAAYAAAAIAQSVATTASDPEEANRQYETLVAAYHALVGAGTEGLSQLRSLAGSRDARVQQWAASHLLWHDRDVAEGILEALAASSGLIAFNARMTLQQWRKGALARP